MADKRRTSQNSEKLTTSSAFAEYSTIKCGIQILPWLVLLKRSRPDGRQKTNVASKRIFESSRGQADIDGIQNRLNIG